MTESYKIESFEDQTDTKVFLSIEIPRDKVQNRRQEIDLRYTEEADGEIVEDSTFPVRLEDLIALGNVAASILSRGRMPSERRVKTVGELFPKVKAERR